jgi:hypothetical protein
MEKDYQARVMMYLQELWKDMPLVVVTDSTGKSLHAAFYCRGMQEQEIAQRHLYACKLVMCLLNNGDASSFEFPS